MSNKYDGWVDTQYIAEIKRLEAIIEDLSDSKGRRAYELRMVGLSWGDIGVKVGSNTALLLAKNYAKKNAYKWPITV